jgi:dihydroorotate dehydrogenase electron transfer subunit
LRLITATVIDNKQILEGIRHRSGRSILSVQLIRLRCSQIEKPEPGQFVMVRCGEESALPRPFSIHQVNGDSIGLFFNVWEGGKGTQWLAQLQVGDTLKLFGPLGNGFTIQPDSKKLLLLSGGIGIAPLRFLADEAIKRGLSVTLLCGTPTSHRYPPESLPPKIELVTVTEDGSAGKKGMITDVLPDFIKDSNQIFACGPLVMYQTMAKMSELKTKSVQISLEVRMGCGLGVCYGCTVKTKNGLKQVCQNGPIFELNDILWEELAEGGV